MSATQRDDLPAQHDKSARPATTALWLAVIVALGAALRLYQLGAESYWLDENDTVRLAALPLINLLRSLATPDRAPLYYLLAHGWIRMVGNGEAAMRLLSALAGIASVPLLFCVGRALLDQKVGLLAAALLAVSEFAIRQAQEVRYYSFVLLLTLLAAWCAIRARDHGRTSDFLALTITTLLLVSAHFYTLFWLAALWLYLLLRRPWTRGAAGTARQWLSWQALTVIGLLPLPLLAVRALWRGKYKPLGWLSRPEPWAPVRDAVSYVIPQHTPAIALAGFALLALLLGGIAVVRWRASGGEREATRLPVETLWLLGLWAACPLLIPFILSWTVEPLYIDRYTVPALPAILLLVAAGLLALRSVLPLPLTVALLAIPIVPGLANYYATPVNEQWREAAAYVDAQAQPGDIVVFAPADGMSTAQSFGWYDRRALPTCGIGIELVTAAEIRAALDRCGPTGRRWLVLRGGFETSNARGAQFATYFIDAPPADRQRLDERHFTSLTVLLFSESIP